MKILVESHGLPSFYKFFGKQTKLEIAEGTLLDLITNLVNSADIKTRKILLDQSGDLDMNIQIMLNEEGFVPKNEWSQKQLKDGDRVRIILIACGG